MRGEVVSKPLIFTVGPEVEDSTTRLERMRLTIGWHEERTWPALCPVLSVVVLTATVSLVAMIWR